MTGLNFGLFRSDIHPWRAPDKKTVHRGLSVAVITAHEPFHSTAQRSVLLCGVDAGLEATNCMMRNAKGLPAEPDDHVCLRFVTYSDAVGRSPTLVTPASEYA